MPYRFGLWRSIPRQERCYLGYYAKDAMSQRTARLTSGRRHLGFIVDISCFNAERIFVTSTFRDALIEVSRRFI